MKPANRGPRNRNTEEISGEDWLSATKGSQAEPSGAYTVAAGRDGPRRLLAHPFAQVALSTHNPADRNRKTLAFALGRAAGREGRRGSSECRRRCRRIEKILTGVLMEEIRPDPDQLLTTQQAAELLGLHPFTLHGWRCAGRRELPWYVIGAGRIRYRRGDVLDYIQRGLYGQGTVPARFRQAPVVEER
jgi:hypothetical protein